jgi:membrane protein DedA with SNARE-associated domain
MMSPVFLSFLQHFSYVGLFLMLLGAAIVLPIPEEITLLTAGYLIAIGIINWPLGLAVSVVALLAGDSFLFYLARLGGSHAQKLRARVNKIGLEKTWIFSPKQSLRAVFILRFLTGFRFIAPIYAGFEQAKWKWYLLVDLLAILIFVPGMLWLGYFFHASIIPFVAGFEVVRHGVFIIVLAFAGAGMLPVLYRALARQQHRLRNKRSKIKR